MKTTKRDTKRLIKTWTSNKSEYDYTIKEKYNVTYIVNLLKDSKFVPAKELQRKYENYFENAGTNFGDKIPMQVWKNIIAERYEVEETQDEFQEAKFNIDDIINLLPHIEAELGRVKKFIDRIQNTKLEVNKRKVVDIFNDLFKIKK